MAAITCGQRISMLPKSMRKATMKNPLSRVLQDTILLACCNCLCSAPHPAPGALLVADNPCCAEPGSCQADVEHPERLPLILAGFKLLRFLSTKTAADASNLSPNCRQINMSGAHDEPCQLGLLNTSAVARTARTTEIR